MTNSDAIASEIKRLRNHGSLKRSVHSFGFNSRLDDLHAAILSVKLKHITAWTDRRRAIAAMFTKGLADCTNVLKLPYECPVIAMSTISTSSRRRTASATKC